MSVSFADTCLSLYGVKPQSKSSSCKGLIPSQGTWPCQGMEVQEGQEAREAWGSNGDTEKFLVGVLFKDLVILESCFHVNDNLLSASVGM